MISAIDYRGMYVHDCTLSGERRADDVFPGHPNGIPLSRDRWFVIYATRGWRKVDDDRSIVYQLRAGGPAGAVLKEGFLRQAADDWDPRGDGSRLLREHGHPVAFGVPKGARIEGKPVAHENVFVAKWRVNSKGMLDPETGHIVAPPEGYESLMAIEWMQFRLNDAGDDIEILQPVRRLRQRGFAADPRYCVHEDAGSMNQTFVQAVPFDPFATEWVDVAHFTTIGTTARKSGTTRVAVLKYRFNPDCGLYEWVETSPFLFTGGNGVGEGSIARLPEGWLIAARGAGLAAWARTDDPFSRLPPATFTTRPVISQPLCLYRCADGVPRLFTGDSALSPYGHGRNPLYCWDIDPVSFAAGECRMVFDCVASGTLPNATIPRAEMCKLLPHMGGREQVLVWRVRTKNVGHAYGSLPPVTDEWKQAHGLHWAVITYDREYPGMWSFA